MGSFLSETAYCLHLFDIIDRFPLLSNVILSVTHNSSLLLLSSLLGILIMYIYSFFGFYFIAEDYFNGDVWDENGNPVSEN